MYYVVAHHNEVYFNITITALRGVLEEFRNIIMTNIIIKLKKLKY